MSWILRGNFERELLRSMTMISSLFSSITLNRILLQSRWSRTLSLDRERRSKEISLP